MATRIGTHRKLRLEPLERREMLDGNPQIVGEDHGSAFLFELGGRPTFVEEDRLLQIVGTETIQLEAAPPLARGRLVGDQYYLVTPADADGLSQLWRTDGTDQGTVQLAEDHSIDFVRITNGDQTDGKVYFWSHERTVWWQTDGTAEGTSRIAASAEDGFESLEPHFSRSVHSGNALYFWAWGTDQVLKLWKADNTQSNAVLIKDLEWPPYTFRLRYFMHDFSGELLFYFPNNNHQTELWKLGKPTGAADYTVWRDGLGTTHTEADYDVWKNSYGSSAAELVAVLDGGDGITAAAESQLFLRRGGQLWRSDGTSQSTFSLTDLIHSEQMTVAGDRLFFLGETEETGVELWTSDGTVEGTHIVKDIMPGRGSGCGGSQLATWRTAGGKLFFTAYNEEGQLGLWSSDGTEEGTVQLHDRDVKLKRGVYPESVVYFTGNGETTPGSGTELWRSDGTVAGTELIVDLHPGPDDFTTSESGKYSPPIERVNEFNGTLYFTGNDGVHGDQLWRLPLDTDQPGELAGDLTGNGINSQAAAATLLKELRLTLNSRLRSIAPGTADQQVRDMARLNLSNTADAEVHVQSPSTTLRKGTDVNRPADTAGGTERTSRLVTILLRRIDSGGQELSPDVGADSVNS